MRELLNRYSLRAKTWTTLATRYAIVDKLFQFSLVFLLSFLIFLKIIEEFPLANYFGVSLLYYYIIVVLLLLINIVQFKSRMLLCFIHLQFIFKKYKET